MTGRWALGLALGLALGACDEAPPLDGGAPLDAGARDAGHDGGGGFDGGPDFDAGALPDAGPPGDAGAPPSGWAPQPWEDCEGGGRVLTADPSDYRAVLDTLAPGDTLRLAPGDYTRGLPLRVSGEEGRCIVIEASDPSARPRFEGSDAFNVIAIHGASWIKVRHLDVDGLGRAGFGVASQGGDAMPTHHVVIEDLRMVGLGANQQIVGISTKSPAWDWVIRGNRIEGAGTGMYLGNSDGTFPFIRGVVEHNTVLGSIGYDAQIKHQVARPALPGMPPDGAVTIVRYNVFSKGDGSSSGGDARPNLLLGHFPPAGAGAGDRYLVYGNLFYDNPTENLLQAEGNLAIYANVFVNPRGGAINIQRHNGAPRLVDVFFNTIVAEGRGLSITGGEAGFAQRSRYNAIFGPTPLRADDARGDVTGSMADAAAALASPTGAPGAGLDVHPSGSALEVAVDAAEVPDVLDARRDFAARDDARLRWAGALAGPADARSVPLALAARPYGG
ncbi:MAG: hypothetical protein KF729_25410 [Sandaracinaceae bacterium]|nr:hypothetical protein [Sandaracinaceae bacterium]